MHNLAQEFTPTAPGWGNVAAAETEEAENSSQQYDANISADVPIFQPSTLTMVHPQTMLDENGFIVPQLNPYIYQSGPLPHVKISLYIC
jgi:hypothetical protein